MYKFGDLIQFNEEYISSKPNTIDLTDKDTVEYFLEDTKIELLEEINCKKIHRFKKNKTGIFLGITKINLSFYYDYVDEVETDFGIISDRYIATKSNFIEVAEIRCENIKKSYYVPLNNIKKVDG